MKRIKKVLSYLIFLVFILNITSCKKEGSISNGNSIPQHIAPVAGALSLNVNSLILHVNDVSTLSAKLFNPNGSITSASSIVWQTGNSAIAIVSNGLVTAKAIGNCEITATDGIHGILSVNVSVIPDTITISDSATQVSWSLNNDLLIMAPNSDTVIAGYKVYDAKGHIVNVPLTFIPPTGSGLAFSGNHITSESATGTFNVTILAGVDTLHDILKVLVAAKNSDTTYTIISASGPTTFNVKKFPLESDRPLIINVVKTWYKNGQIQTFSFTTSPDKLVNYTNNAIELNSNGNLEAYTLTGEIETHAIGFELHYKDTWVWWPMNNVITNMEDNWGVKLSNGDEYNFCINNYEDEIVYSTTQNLITEGLPGFSYNPNLSQLNMNVSGTYYINEKGKQITYGGNNLFQGLSGRQFNNVNYNAIEITFNNGIMANLNGSLNTMNYVCISNGLEDQATLTRGIGNCTAVNNSDTIGSFSYGGNTYSGICSSETDIGTGGPIGNIDVVILASPASFIIYNMPKQSSGTYSFTDGWVNSGDSSLYALASGMNDVYGSLSGTVTKTSSNQFTFTCTMNDGANEVTPGSGIQVIMTGSGTY